ncbi:GNAT family N-acetyltransferase [Vibrio sp. SCSIO 43137]|uniref:GNAT family N-acetyltransferase n=1 Tax=Vibrio sp. SCSIO 43137 TaxID=3021011 RepID=UPI00230814FB|nr:GNAT family N-acetyltransferase [Vibrio sp. SCSIO 43137]WCE30337.1 GNAT family N-acetyltransferase [Vibrio sp. SCSIO 43137]
MKQEKIETERLLLRPFYLSDSKRVAELAGDKRVSDMTANIPYPYEESVATDWISSHASLFSDRKEVVYGITKKGSDEVIGAVGMVMQPDGCGVLGYWLGVEFWGKGFATEAAHGLIEFCRSQLDMTAIEVWHLVENNQSQSVINKLNIPYIENRQIKKLDQQREICVYRQDFNPR